MRVTWLVAWASLAALIGCANNNQPTGPGTYSIGQYGGAPAAPAAAGSYGSAVAQADAGAVRPASWTQRVASVFKQNPMKTLGLDKDVASAARPTPADSISLNYRSADPSPELLVSMGAVSDQAGSTDQARQLYQRALTAQPGHAGALMALARLEDRHGNLPAALQRYQEAATQNPENATVLNDLALCHARMGDLPQSLLLLHQATKIDPDRALYRNNIAKVLVEMNRVEDALAELSVVHSPGHAHYNIGVLLNERGRQAEAAHFAQSALLFDPQLTQAQQLLTLLQPSSPTQTWGSHGGQGVAAGPALTASKPTRESAAAYGAAPPAQSWETSGRPTSSPVGFEPVLLPPTGS